MRKILAALLLVVMTSFIVGCGTDMDDERKEQAKYRRITGDEAMLLMQQTEDYLILDVRFPEDYAAGHIPHAINIPLEDFGEEPPKELPDRNQTIFIYCTKGVRSMNVANRLAHMGYRNIIEIGGIEDWHGEIEK